MNFHDTNFSQVEGEDVLIIVNQAEAGICDVTLASIRQARINDKYTSLNLDPNDPPWFHLVLGRRIRYTYPSDLSSITVLTEDLFLPPAFVDDLFADKLYEEAMAAASCRINESSCPDEFAINGCWDWFDRVERLTSLPLTTVNARGLTTVDANSTAGCRFLHANSAALRPDVHSPHLSFRPIEDIDGQTKCSESNANEDFFSEDDFLLFKRAARSAGLNATTYYKELESTDDLRQCIYGDFVESSAIQGVQFLPDDFFCYSYLETQNATGEKNNAYWAALFSFWIVFRTLSFVMLRRKALS